MHYFYGEFYSTNMNSNFFFLCFVFTLITLTISPAKAFILMNQSKQNYDDYNNIPIEINDTELTDKKLNEFAQIEEFEELLPAPMAQVVDPDIIPKCPKGTDRLPNGECLPPF
ncbi:hypothetical protein KQX54_016666 [Cotesia glomerata]|uniref:Uncharacterized protein n=1 Tax=Cotesia glomerata TaxID=32391 RepID=A0AAV7IZ90_COTGL|nr:hypothetical protein KQX54_016666 [Cotesia glomerata]